MSMFNTSSWSPNSLSFSKLHKSLSDAITGAPNPDYGQFEDQAQNFVTLKVDVDKIGTEGDKTPSGKQLQMEVPEGTERIVKVIVPERVKQGEEFLIEAGEGRTLKTVCPPGKGPGEVLWIPVPKRKEPTNSIDQMADWLNKALPF